MATTETATYKGVTYPNGSCPTRFLARLDGDNYGDEPAVLREDAAESWNRARADVLVRTSYVLTVRGWNRTVAEQETFFFQRYAPGAHSPFGDYRTYKGITYGRTNDAAAAIPGTSNHGLGLAVDVNDFGGEGDFDDPRRVASIEILKTHGWTDDEGRSIDEPWHLVYSPAKDTRPEPKETFLMALTEDEQEALKNDASAILMIVKQLRTKIERLETDETARRTAELKYQRASAAREAVLVEGMKTLAGSSGVSPETLERLLAEAFQNITLEIVKES